MSAVRSAVRPLRPFEGGGGAIAGSAAVGAAGLAWVAVAAAAEPRAAAHAYLLAFAYWAGIAVASLALLAIFHAARARWIVVLRRALEAIAFGCVVLLPLFVPIALSIGEIYPWADPASAFDPHAEALLAKKRAWLDVPAFLLRAVLYLALWAAVAALLRSLSRRQDVRGGFDLTARQRVVGSAALPLLAVTGTFAAFDWLMSLDPLWYSTVFGLYYLAGSMVAAVALLVLVAAFALSEGWLGGLTRPIHLVDLGKLLLAFVPFWAYIAFSQALLVWIADLPEEVPWYLLRLRPPWRAVGLLAVVGQFVVPFAFLLSRARKGRPRSMGLLALWILGVHFADLLWIVGPVLRPSGPVLRAIDLAALVGVGGVCAAFVLASQRGAYTVPVGDPYLEDSQVYRR